MDLKRLCVMFLIGLLVTDVASINPRQRKKKRGRVRAGRKFLRKVEKRIRNGKQIFSERALDLLSNGMGVKNVRNNVNKGFGRCDIPNEEVIKQMFSSFFKSVDDIYQMPEMKQNASTMRNNEPKASREWTGVAALRIAMPKEVESDLPPIAGKPISPGGTVRDGLICNCCKTTRFFESFSNITIDKTTYRVINLPKQRQFFATERCPENPQCPFGGCIQRFTRHAVLIWNDTQPYFPPFDFAGIDIPTHCEWGNIGRN